MGIGASVISRQEHILVYDAPPVPLPVQVVQSAWSTGLTGTATAAVPLEPTRDGNCLVVVVVTANAVTNATVQAVTANGAAGNFGALHPPEGTGTSPAIVSMWACPGCARGLTEVEITTTGGAGDSLMSVLVLEVQGLAATLTGLLDQSAGATGTGTAWSSGPTPATTQASELWIGAAGGYAAGTSCLFTGPGAPWNGVNVAANPFAAGYQVVTAEGAAEWAGTAAASAGWTAAVITLRPATPGVLLGAMSDAVLTDATGATVPQGSLITTGQFYEYAGTPAAGNPPITWAVPAGTASDPYGNALVQSGGVVTATPAPPYVVYSKLSAGALLLGSTDGDVWTASLDPGTSDLVFKFGAGGPLTVPGIVFWMTSTGQLVCQEPGTAGVQESWHTFALNSGFGSAGAPWAAPGYQYEPTNGGRVRLRGQVSLTAAQAASASICNLPLGYRPTYQQAYMTPNTLSGFTIGNYSVYVATGGDVRIGDTGASGDYVSLDGIVLELD